MFRKQRPQTRKVHSLFSPGRPFYRTSGRNAPEKAGKYFVIEDEEVRYIGISGNISRRIEDHIRAGRIGDNAEVRYKIISIDNIRQLGLDIQEVIELLRYDEAREIESRRPVYNERKGGGGRNPNLNYIEQQLKEMDEGIIERLKMRFFGGQ